TNNSFVNLKVFDVLGKEVATLVNEKLQPGEYEATFDGVDNTSGTYFYKLTVGSFSDTKKMLLIK
ncbi:MAG: T9SS type A sorting domain-containing protein, partial [Ignavibacteriae bacterium]|nr:T9SS type A sorting domain-containing protein [Ignavibacteriota bacterium]